MDKLVLKLSDAQNVTLAGGKGASLARLVKAGFNVPDGFVVTTSAKSHDEELESEILEAFDKLGAKYVAVRSSAVAEDGAKDAWAGQMDTFLNVSRAELLEKVRLCRESGQSDRAKSYASQKGLKSGNVAVVVQPMVQSKISGVAFSVHPVSNNSDQIVLEAVRGLGEKLVSGKTTPDTYVVNKSSGLLVESYLSAEQQILSEPQIKELAKVIKNIESFFGFPVDVEWAYAEGKLYILQSRPITTLG
jgi:phosphoenolpyruvate synthase/pyruvate phosphate dikinase